ncbi:MAG: hypothetical protein ABIN61_00475 [candidate division WOR-3 bacterium]
MRNFFKFLSMFCIAVFAQSGWEHQTNPLGYGEEAMIGKVEAVSSGGDVYEVWISTSRGAGFLYTNSSSGGNWILRNSFPNDTVWSLSDPSITMCWVSPLRGWKIGTVGMGFEDAKGAVVYKTIDGGSNWDKVGLSNNPGDMGVQIQFVNNMVGWASIFNPNSGMATFLKSVDGGNNWVNITQAGGGPPTGGIFYFVDENNGWGVNNAHMASPPYGIIRTTDGGWNWTNQYADPSGTGFSALQFVDLNNGWVVGEGKILKTTDGGENWTLITNTGLPENTQYRCLFFLDANKGWIGANAPGNPGWNGILYTSNGGTSWELQEIPFLSDTNPVFSIFFLDAETGWFTADLGIIGYTTTGGLGVGEVTNKKEGILSLKQVPFGLNVEISFCILKRSQVNLKIYNLIGEEVETIVNDEILKEGVYNKLWDTKNLSSGIYFCRLEVGGFLADIRKIVLVR